MRGGGSITPVIEEISPKESITQISTRAGEIAFRQNSLMMSSLNIRKQSIRPEEVNLAQVGLVPYTQPRPYGCSWNRGYCLGETIHGRRYPYNYNHGSQPTIFYQGQHRTICSDGTYRYIGSCPRSLPLVSPRNNNPSTPTNDQVASQENPLDSLSRVGTFDSDCSDKSCRISSGFVIDFSNLNSTVHSPFYREITLLEQEEVDLVERLNDEDTTGSLTGTLDHSVFSSIAKSTHGENIWRYSLVFGERHFSRPTVSGTWKGLMTGVMLTSDDFLSGTATLEYEVSDSDGTLSADFSNIKNLTQDHPHSHTEIPFGFIEVSSDGSFEQGRQGNSIKGAFYGEGGSEISGVFERYGILGAFGTKRSN